MVSTGSEFSSVDGWLSKLTEGTPLSEGEVKNLVEKVRGGPAERGRNLERREGL